ncbi:DUF3822 family protein [Pontimicrobium sp. SW4]|uniref:DUF3822 family protein n=1 Tax=Pontimicrobium sp. SW4 TaxID=3153519 RepID=A0AAU7BXD8_9FLAO
MSIQVSLSGLSFCVLNLSTQSVVFYKKILFDKKLNPSDVLDKLTHQFNTEDSLKESFKSVTVIHENELSALVPKSLFNEEHLADYLKFNSKILRSDFITYDEISTNDSVNVYVPYVNINNYIYDSFGEFEFKHFSTIVLETLLNLEKNAQTTKMYIHIADTHFEIIVIKKGQLQLYNTFDYSTKEDFIYYILFTAEQLELNPEKTPLILLGNVTKENELYKIAYTYVRNVSIIEPKTTITPAEGISKAYLSNFVITNSF